MNAVKLVFYKKLRRIILIDDDEVTCFIKKLLLEGMEIASKIDCVHDGLEGLKYIHQHCLEGAIEQQAAPDLIFLDNNMPILNGFEFLEALEEIEDVDRSRLYIVMLTTNLSLLDYTARNSSPFCTT